MPDHSAKEGFALDFSIENLGFEEGAPAPERVIAGSARFRIWEVDAQPGGLHAGLWESTPGKWRVEYDEWEYCRILSGVCVVTEDGGAPRRLAAGDSLIIRPGFKGVWEVLETARKEFVVRA